MLLPIVLAENVQNCLSYGTITCNTPTLEKHFGGISRKVENTHIENCLSTGGIITKQREIGISGTLLGLPFPTTRGNKHTFWITYVNYTKWGTGFSAIQ